MPRRYPCRETDTETDSERQIGPLESRILGKLVSPLRKGADGKGTLPVFRHCGRKRTHELRHKPFPRQPPTLPQWQSQSPAWPEGPTQRIPRQIGHRSAALDASASAGRRNACAFRNQRRRRRLPVYGQAIISTSTSSLRIAIVAFSSFRTFSVAGVIEPPGHGIPAVGSHEGTPSVVA